MIAHIASRDYLSEQILLRFPGFYANKVVQVCLWKVKNSLLCFFWETSAWFVYLAVTQSLKITSVTPYKPLFYGWSKKAEFTHTGCYSDVSYSAVSPISQPFRGLNGNRKCCFYLRFSSSLCFMCKGAVLQPCQLQVCCFLTGFKNKS